MDLPHGPAASSAVVLAAAGAGSAVLATVPELTPTAVIGAGFLTLVGLLVWMVKDQAAQSRDRERTARERDEALQAERVADRAKGREERQRILADALAAGREDRKAFIAELRRINSEQVAALDRSTAAKVEGFRELRDDVLDGRACRLGGAQFRPNESGPVARAD